MGCHDRELSILFTSDEKIGQLNSQYLGRIGPTNVLAFPMDAGESQSFDCSMMGDVVISVDTALRESQVCGQTPEYTINRLLVHGVLHLLGYDHEKSAAEAERMEKEEERLTALIWEDSEHGTVSG